MISHTYATDSQAKSTDLAATILSAASPPQISDACVSIESFLHKHAPDQARWFFSITFPTLICKLFGFDDSPAQRPRSPNGWIDIVSSSGDSELAARVFKLLSPNGILLSSIAAVDRLSLVKYVFPAERLPEWIRFVLQNDRDCRVLEDLCPLFKGRVSIKGSSPQIQLNVFEYYMFWFAYYPVCRGNCEDCDTIKVSRSKRFRLENWAHSIPGFSNPRRGKEQKNECNIYVRLLYSYLRKFVPLYDLNLNAHQPYRSSLLHYSQVYDSSVLENAEFFVYTLIQFWLVDNDLSPLPVKLAKSFGVAFPFTSVLGESPPTPGLSVVVNVLIKYLNLSSTTVTERYDHVESTGSPQWKVPGSVDIGKSRDMMPAYPVLLASCSWNSMFQRHLYRFILRTFLFCPVETSIKNASEVFSLWINFIEPWMVSLEDFGELGADVGDSINSPTNEFPQSPSRGYSSSWQGFVLSNYLFYSSLVMHFVGFAHKFLHSDAEVIVQMVSKVLNTLISSMELMELIKNIDTAFHSKPSGSSKSMLNSLYRYVPVIREQLEDWEDGLCESDADGSFLHENWNKDLRLFSDSEDGGQQLLQLFILRAEAELQAISGENLGRNLNHLESIKTQMRCLFGANYESCISLSSPPDSRQKQLHKQSRNEIFKPRMVPALHRGVKGDWMRRPISNDEVAWLAKLMVDLSGWVNESLGLNQSGEEGARVGPSWSYVEVPTGEAKNVNGVWETVRVVTHSIGSWVRVMGGAAVTLMRKHGVRVNLRMLAAKKVVMVFLIVAVFGVLKSVFGDSSNRLCV